MLFLHSVFIASKHLQETRFSVPVSRHTSRRNTLRLPRCHVTRHLMLIGRKTHSGSSTKSTCRRALTCSRDWRSTCTSGLNERKPFIPEGLEKNLCRQYADLVTTAMFNKRDWQCIINRHEYQRKQMKKMRAKESIINPDGLVYGQSDREQTSGQI